VIQIGFSWKKVLQIVLGLLWLFLESLLRRTLSGPHLRDNNSWTTIEFLTMEFLRRKTLATIAFVLMMLLATGANEVEGVKEPASKQDTSKDENLPKGNSSKEVEVAPEKEAVKEGSEVEASAGKDEKKSQEETSDAKDGGDDDVNGVDEGQSGSELQNLESSANSKGNGEAPSNKTKDIGPNITTLDHSNNLTTILNPSLIANSKPDANVNGMDKSTESYDPNTSAGDDDTTIGSSSSAFVARGSSSSSSTTANNQEMAPAGEQKPTESNENNQKEASGPGKVVSNNENPKTAELEETSNGEGKEVASQEEAAKEADPALEETKAIESDISKKEEDVMDVDAPEAKVDSPLETSFEKQMGSGIADPPQSNFFSYFIVLAIITIIAYLVFHNKKKVNEENTRRLKSLFLRSWVS